MIKFDNVSLKFSDQIICERLNFDVKCGDSFCLSGPSGIGKSTLLKLMLGIILPDSGDIFIDGHKLASDNVEELRKQMSWLPQNVNLPVDSGQELIELLQLNEKQVEMFKHYLQQLEINNGEQERVFTEISGGQKQRIVLAASLSLQKPIILLDEPTSALDEESIELLIQLVNSLKDRTVVSTSHNSQWVKSCSNVFEL
ncbi:ATP-binding cassette domain-containing protein [Marinifilum fragile]|uniref:ABC transporter ATP-binding protein n=1 Tax=Marinifilum fragile TaxID=570161 RepID=UPI002AA69C25|nr:ATP-binding cassette domain-containing protein [Marinifilum fragile]